jgi:hypothetical protein
MFESTSCDWPPFSPFERERERETSFPLHGYGVHTHVFGLLCHLGHCATRTAATGEAISNDGTGNALSLSHLLSNDNHEDPVDGGGHGNTAQQTTLAHRFGGFTEGITGEEVGQQADTAIIEATAESVFPVHFLLLDLEGQSEREELRKSEK